MRSTVDGRRAGRRTTLVLLAALLASGTTTPARAESVDERVQRAQAELEGSSARVQAAGVALARAAATLPTAQRDVNAARADLDAAQQALAVRTAAVTVGEAGVRSAERRVAAAQEQVDATALQLGRLIRRTYQAGPLQRVRAIATSGPEAFLQRTALLQRAFRGSDDVLQSVSAQRRALAREQVGVQVAQTALSAARDAAAREAAHAQDLIGRTEAAAARVTEIARARAQGLRDAREARADDLADYRAAQAASAELARRLREAAARAAREVVRRAASTSGWLWPADGPLTSRYGYRTHPIYGDRRFHAGIDIGAGYGNPVSASQAGTVVYAGSARGYGTLVLISHGTRDGKDLATGYAHMSSLLVSEGQTVSRGQTVGRVGNEGNSTGPHLHFEVRLDGDPVDPLDYVSAP